MYSLVIGRRGILSARVFLFSAIALALSASAAENRVKVAGVYTAPIEQQWVSRIHKALKDAETRGEIEYAFSESVPTSDIQRVQREYATKGYQLIVGDAFADERGFRRLAKDFPTTKFLLGSSFPPQDNNLSVFDNYIQDCSYLTGLIAGGMAKSNVIGMVGGYAIPEVNRLMQAFMTGARETNPRVKFLVSFIGSWYDPPKAKEAALAQIDAGADVLYAERFGVADAAKERRKLAIGNVVDTQQQYPLTIVTSAVWNFEPTAKRAIAKVRDGSFTAEDYGPYSELRNGGCELAPLGKFEDMVPGDLRAKVKQREEQIRQGTFTVKRSDIAPTSTP
jgi:basic membrane protein A and related proteins